MKIIARCGSEKSSKKLREVPVGVPYTNVTGGAVVPSSIYMRLHNGVVDLTNNRFYTAQEWGGSLGEDYVHTCYREFPEAKIVLYGDGEK